MVSSQALYHGSTSTSSTNLTWHKWRSMTFLRWWNKKIKKSFHYSFENFDLWLMSNNEAFLFSHTFMRFIFHSKIVFTFWNLWAAYTFGPFMSQSSSEILKVLDDKKKKLFAMAKRIKSFFCSHYSIFQWVRSSRSSFSTFILATHS